MSHKIGAAHDPSVADYRATSPRCAQGGSRLWGGSLLGAKLA